MTARPFPADRPGAAPSQGAAAERVLRRLELQVLRRLDGRLQGDHRTLYHGEGVDFADLRAYEPGDDVRSIDWNVTARTDTVHVRTYLEDRELTAWLLLDRSGSMAFGRSGRQKAEVLVELAALLARLVGRNGSRVGAILYDNAVERVIPPRTGRRQVLRVTHELLRTPARPPAAGATDLSGLLRAGLSTIRRRSLVVLVSDFISAPGWERPLTQLARRHEILAVRLVDPSEEELPAAGLLALEDAETHEVFTVDTADPEFRARYAELALARRLELHALARKAGVELHVVSTADDLLGALVRLVELARRR